MNWKIKFKLQFFILIAISVKVLNFKENHTKYETYKFIKSNQKQNYNKMYKITQEIHKYILPMLSFLVTLFFILFSILTYNNAYLCYRDVVVQK